LNTVFDNDDKRIIACGQPLLPQWGEINAELGTLDPTMMLNGLFVYGCRYRHLRTNLRASIAVIVERS